MVQLEDGLWEQVVVAGGESWEPVNGTVVSSKHFIHIHALRNGTISECAATVMLRDAIGEGNASGKFLGLPKKRQGNRCNV